MDRKNTINKENLINIRPTQANLNDMTSREKDAVIFALFDRLEELECPRCEEWDLDVFFSYTHHDGYLSDRGTAFVGLLKKNVNDLCGHNLKLFIDDNNLQLGESWSPAIEKAIYNSKIFLALLTEHYFKSDVCRKELSNFLGHLSAEPGNQRYLIPLLWNHQGVYERQEYDELYSVLRGFQWGFEYLDRKQIEVRKEVIKDTRPMEVDAAIKDLAERICHILGKTCHRTIF
jgi:hypothetical protein